MDSILYKIIEIEKAARLIDEEVAKAKREMPLEIESKRAELEKQLGQQVEQKVALYAKKEAEQEEGLKRAAEESKQESLKILREQFEKNKAAWENEIFENIIGRSGENAG